ncbi:MAG: RNA polymerase sigma factor [Bacteroidales bacterium]|nr:RNA polymerase sigma factor [Bacteroidales bacterium]
MEKKAFMEQVSAYSQDLKNYLMSHLHDSAAADDLAHDCLVQAAELYEQDRFDEGKSLKNWLFCMAYSRLIDHVRRLENRQRHQTLYPDKIREALGWEPVPSAATPAQAVLSPLPERHAYKTSYARRLLQTRFADLPLSAQQRTLLQMRYIEQLSYRQIASRLHAPLSTVISRHACAIRLLRGDYMASYYRRQQQRAADSAPC